MIGTAMTGWACRMIGVAATAALWLLVSGRAPLAGQVTPPDSAASSAEAFARQWLATLDRGEHAGAWQLNVAMMRASVPLDQWRDAIVQARAGLEPFTGRTLLSVARAAGMGPVTGEQFQVVFRTTTSAGATATETLLAAREDGEWRIAGYGVRRNEAR